MQSIPNGYVDAWSRRIHLAYQDYGFRLRGTMMPPERVSAEKIHWRVLGKGKASRTERGDNVKTMNAPLNVVSKDIEDWDAAEYIYEKDLPQLGDITPSMQDNLKTIIMAALGRKADEMVIDELGAQTYAPDHQLGDPLQPMTLNLAREIAMSLKKFTSLMPGRKFCLLDSNAWEQLMGYQQFAGREYVSDEPFMKVAVDTPRMWDGVIWIPFPDDALPLNVSERTTYAWHEAALGYGEYGETIFKVDWVPEKKGWLHRATINGAVKAIQPEGIVQIKTKADAPLV